MSLHRWCISNLGREDIAGEGVPQEQVEVALHLKHAAAEGWLVSPVADGRQLHESGQGRGISNWRGHRAG